ncbi:hypothetical protein ACTXT7_014695 [Hymenolepis weldensis]
MKLRSLLRAYVFWLLGVYQIRTSIGQLEQINWSEVKFIDSEGALACTGLPPLAQSFMRKSSAKSSLRFLTSKQMTSEPELVPWTATEINHRLLNPLFKKHETLGTSSHTNPPP